MRFNDLTGKKFGMLTALNVSQTRLRNVMSWDCICDCGNLKTVAAPDLRTGDVKSCGCQKHKGTPKDVSGVKRGSLTAISNTGNKRKNGDYLWNFKCDCGNDHVMALGDFNYKDYPTCTECGKKRLIEANTTHGFKNNHKTYKAWCKIRDRCFNVNSPDYKDYGAKGITVAKEFCEDFMNFYNEIGEAPNDGQRWSVDRIDHTKNYEPGNIRWATDFQQARNKGMLSVNSSGVTGVHWDNKISKKSSISSTYAVAQWIEYHDGNRVYCKKSFSVKKLGLLEAFAMACQFREDKISELNVMGYGYAENHGK